ncbi:MAG: DUF3500 domain-containing protein [Janthinobacterium lividum]
MLLNGVMAAQADEATVHAFLAPYRTANTAAVVAAANTFLGTLTTTEVAETVYPYTLTNVERWSNLPGATRNGPTLGSATTTSTSTAASTTATSTAVAAPTGSMGPSGSGTPPSGAPTGMGGGTTSSTGSGTTTTLATFVMSDTQRAAALTLVQAALSTAGYATMAKIRAADDVIEATDSSQPWGSANYHVAMLGTPSTTAPWMLQISGHHLTYNITYNATNVSATPMFIGTEPPNFTVLSDGTTVVTGNVNGSTEYFVNGVLTLTAPDGTVTQSVAPIETQRAAVYSVLSAIQSDSNAAAAAKLAGSFDDVTMGISSTSSGNNDTNYPFNSAVETTELYPTGVTNRGVLYPALSPAEQKLVLTAMAAWVNTQKSDIATELLSVYTSADALAQTYVAYSPGESGTADFSANPNMLANPGATQGSYFRIDGPRLWIEAIVQEAVAYRAETWVHYHTLWRDKTADYGACFSSGASASTC